VYSLGAYGDMIAAAKRREAYLAALRKTVRPGDLVLELGTGPGFFALAAARLGARVVAVEPQPVIGLARRLARDNGLEHLIEFREVRSTELHLAERADVLLSDLRGVLPVHGRHLTDLADARTRLLKSGGAVIAARDRLWGAVAEMPEVDARLRGAWIDNGSGLDLRAAWAAAASTPLKVHARVEELVGDAVQWAALEYATVQDASVSGVVRTVARRAATAHGVALWFDSTLAEGAEISNAPGAEAAGYGNLFLPFEAPLPLAPGDAATVRLSAHLVAGDTIWRWDTVVERAGSETALFSQSSFHAAPFSLESLRKRSESHVPRLTEEGELTAFLLTRMRGDATLGQISREAAARFPARFPDLESALALLGELSSRYGA
jgi:SAM-dependent methyltransferase